MVHTFSCLGSRFALDVESGSVYEIDDLTYRLLDSPLDNTEGEFSRYPKSEIEEAKAEIEKLKKEGVLFTPETLHEPPVYNGIIKAMCLNISHDCNLRCEYCFADTGAYSGRRGNMSLEVAKKAIDFLIEKSGTRRNLEIDFFGGEPTLNYDVVVKTVEYARSIEKERGKNIRFTITTNALWLNDEMIDFFNREMYNVVLSIDGRKDVHNSVRKTKGGKDSYDVIVANALKFRKTRGDKQYYVRGTFTSRNPDFCADVLALNDLGFDRISIEPVVLPEGHPLAIKEEQLPLIKEQYELLAEEYLKRLGTDKQFIFFHYMLDLDGGPCEKKRLVGCSAGNEYVAVSPDGSIFPCHQFDGKPEYKIGNVTDGSFDKTIPVLFAENNLTQKPECLKCFAKYYCSGGCAANSLNMCGDMKKPYKLACELMKKRLECSIAIKAREKNLF